MIVFWFLFLLCVLRGFEKDFEGGERNGGGNGCGWCFVKSVVLVLNWKGSDDIKW